MMAAFALGLLGVDDEAITEDYLASNAYNAVRNAELYDRLERVGVDRELVRPLTEQQPEVIAAMLTAVHGEHGGWERLSIDRLGMDPVVLERFRARMLAP